MDASANRSSVKVAAARASIGSRRRRDGDGTQHVVGEKDADGQEGQGGSDRQAVEAGSDEGIAGDQKGEDGQLGLHVGTIRPRC